MKISWLLFFILGCYLGLQTAAHAQTIELTLEEAIAFALRENKQILVKKEDIVKAKAAIAQAQAAFYPTLTFQSSIAESIGLYSKDIATYLTRTSVSYDLYTGGRSGAQVAYQRKISESTQAQMDRTRLEIITNVKKAHLYLQLARAYRSVNLKIFRNAWSHYHSAAIRYGKGEVPTLDLLDLKAHIHNLRRIYAESCNQVEGLQAELSHLLGLSPDIRVMIPEQASIETIDWDFAQGVLTALQQRPEIRYYESQQAAAQASIKIAKSENKPTIYASWDYYSQSRSGNLSPTPEKGWQDYSIIGLTLSWPIFDGWRTKAKVEQAVSDLKIAALLTEQARLDIANELVQAYLSLSDSVQKYHAARAATFSYRNVVESKTMQFKTGEINTLELSDSILKYDISRFTQFEAVYDFYLGIVMWLRAQGLA